MSTLDECQSLVDGLIADYQAPRIKLDKGNGEFRLRTLLKMAKWAETQQPVKVGDLVNLKYGLCMGMDRSSGWYPYREQLADGPHEVLSIGFNGAHDYWLFETKIDGRIFHVSMTWLDSIVPTVANPQEPCDPSEPPCTPERPQWEDIQP